MKRKFKPVFIALALLASYLFGNFFPVDHFWPGRTPVRFVKDATLPADGHSDLSAFNGVIQTGTPCVRILKKGEFVYLSCAVVVRNEFVESVPNP